VLCEGANRGADALAPLVEHRPPPADPAPTSELANVPFVGVDGHNGYGPYIRFLDAYGITVGDNSPTGPGAGGRGTEAHAGREGT